MRRETARKLPIVAHGRCNMNSIRWTRNLALTLLASLLLGTQSPAGDINKAVKSLDDKHGQCPCFDRQDLAELIEAAAGNAICTYTFNVDRRLRIFDALMPSKQAFTRAGVACSGPKVRGGNAPGLPGVGSFAMYDSEGEDCKDNILAAAKKYGLQCTCIDQDGVAVACPDSL